MGYIRRFNALYIPCPKCGEKKHLPCRTPQDKVRKPHSSRVKEAFTVIKN